MDIRLALPSGTLAHKATAAVGEEFSQFHKNVFLLCFTGTKIKRNSRDTCNFDREFTKMAVELTPTDKLFIMNLDQDEFLGFSYTNPEYVIPTQG
ncbi:hypothetical protein PO909_001461 [Leuciscus waleckii]